MISSSRINILFATITRHLPLRSLKTVSFLVMVGNKERISGDDTLDAMAMPVHHVTHRHVVVPLHSLCAGSAFPDIQMSAGRGQGNALERRPPSYGAPPTTKGAQRPASPRELPNALSTSTDLRVSRVAGVHARQRPEAFRLAFGSPLGLLLVRSAAMHAPRPHGCANAATAFGLPGGV